MINAEIGGDTTDIALWRAEQDTMYFWYTGSDTVEVSLIDNGDPFDTIRLFPQLTEQADVRLKLASGSSHPDKSIAFTSNHPIKAVDERLIQISQGDTLELTEVSAAIDSNDVTLLRVDAPWLPMGKYTVLLLPGAVENIFDNINDTLRTEARFQDRENFGTLNLSITGLDTNVQYLIELIDKETLVESRNVVNIDSLNWVLPQMPVKPYSATIVEDRNRNGIWDTGDLAAKRQPERIFTVSIEGMRPGWDLDFTITWPE